MRKEDKKNTVKHIVFVGESGFPMGLAAIQRITLMAKAFVHSGCKATVVCRKGVGSKKQRVGLQKKGNFEGIDYTYTSKDVYKPEGFLERNVQKIMGMYAEFSYLRKLKKKNETDLVIVSEMNVFHMFRYLVYSKVLNFPIIANFVEMASSMQHRTKVLLRINDYLMDYLAIKMVDGALPISDKLLRYYNKVSPSKPSLKLPILCDFEKFAVEKKTVGPYFLYCGSIGYRQIIDFIVEGFKEVCIKNDTQLYMIVSGGSKNETLQLEQEINIRLGNKKVILFSNIRYEQLIDLYVNALALLIPLRPTVQDASRFPHKIGEYLASGNPVITTNVGEIANYFEDGHTALVADKYDSKAFSEKMQFVLSYPEQSKKIGLNGKELGLREFEYRIHGHRLKKYIRRFSAE